MSVWSQIGFINIVLVLFLYILAENAGGKLAVSKSTRLTVRKLCHPTTSHPQSAYLILLSRSGRLLQILLSLPLRFSSRNPEEFVGAD